MKGRNVETRSTLEKVYAIQIPYLSANHAVLHHKKLEIFEGSLSYSILPMFYNNRESHDYSFSGTRVYRVYKKGVIKDREKTNSCRGRSGVVITTSVPSNMSYGYGGDYLFFYDLELAIASKCSLLQELKIMAMETQRKKLETVKIKFPNTDSSLVNIKKERPELFI